MAAEEVPAPAPSPEEVRAAVDAIVRSAAFARSPRLQEFLRFVCERTLAGQASTINEYLLGVEVFGRGEGYNPAEDAVVRRQAHALRQKLRQYEVEDGATAAVRVDLPVGTYVPVFQRRTTNVGSSPPRPAPAPRWWLLGAAALLGLAVHAGWSWMTAPRPQPPSAADELWARWLASPEPVTLAFSNPATAVVRHVPDPGSRVAFGGVPLASGSAEETRFRRFFGFPADGAVFLWPDGVQGKLGEAYAAVRATALLASRRVVVRPSQSRLLTWERLRDGNVILLGNVETNPWIERLLEKQPLRVAPATGRAPRRIVDDAATGTEPRSYQNRYPEGVTTADDGDVGAIEQYALVSMLPGIEPQKQLLVVAGLNSQVTDAATEMLTDPARAAELTAALRRQAPRGPWYFQAVVRTEVRDRQPTRSTLVRLRLR